MTTTVTSPSPEAASLPSRDWRHAALCRKYDPELWQPIGTSGPAQRQAEEAKALCALCPSVGPCARWALDRGEPVGIWGGLTEDERRDVLERRAVAAWDAPRDPQPERREPNALDALSAEARDALLAAGPRGRTPDGTSMGARRELVRSALAEESISSGHSGQQGGVRATQRGRDALAAYRRREARAGTRVTEQLGLPLAGAL